MVPAKVPAAWGTAPPSVGEGQRQDTSAERESSGLLYKTSVAEVKETGGCPAAFSKSAPEMEVSTALPTEGVGESRAEGACTLLELFLEPLGRDLEVSSG